MGLSPRYLRIHFIVVGIVLPLWLTGCMDSANGQDENQGDPGEEAVTAVPVEAAVVAIRDVSAVYSGTAALEADRRATVVSKISGVILELHAEEGDFVEQGQVLARVETDRYRLEVDRAEAMLERLRTDFERKQDLFERELVSADEFERVRAEYEAQQAAHGLARLELQYTEIRAPIAGYVAERMIRVGNLVNVNDPTFQIASYDPLLAVLHVPERQLSIIRNGLPVTMRADAWPGENFGGEVIRMSPVVDAETGTFRVTAKIEDPDGKLKPGLFGRIDLRYDTHQGVPVVPRSALVTEDDAHHVFIVGEDNTATRRSVVLGYEHAGMVEVVEGLGAGDRVVTAGKGSLSDGATVEVIGVEAFGQGA